MSKKQIQYKCDRCHTDILTIDKVLYRMHCRNCFFIIHDVNTDPWKEVARRGKERRKKGV